MKDVVSQQAILKVMDSLKYRDKADDEKPSLSLGEKLCDQDLQRLSLRLATWINLISE